MSCREPGRSQGLCFSTSAQSRGSGRVSPTGCPRGARSVHLLCPLILRAGWSCGQACRVQGLYPNSPTFVAEPSRSPQVCRLVCPLALSLPVSDLLEPSAFGGRVRVLWSARGRRGARAPPPRGAALSTGSLLRGSAPCPFCWKKSENKGYSSTVYKAPIDKGYESGISEKS